MARGGRHLGTNEMKAFYRDLEEGRLGGWECVCGGGGGGGRLVSEE